MSDRLFLILRACPDIPLTMNAPTLPTIPLTNPFTFLREVRMELKKVEWPRREKIGKLTVVVIGVSLGVGLYIGALDTLFTLLLKNLVQ